jgi:hypothetical protein
MHSGLLRPALYHFTTTTPLLAVRFNLLFYSPRSENHRSNLKYKSLETKAQANPETHTPNFFSYKGRVISW